MSRVVCAGHVNWDVTLYVDELPAVDGEARIHSRQTGGGGSAANVATALVDLGYEAGVVGAVGADDVGRRLKRELDGRSVDVRGLRTVEGGDTSEKFIVVDESGSAFVLGSDGVNEAIEPSALEADLLDGVEHVHLTGQRPETAEALAELAAGTGATVSVDPGRRVADRDFAAVFSLVDVVFLNRVESRSLDEGALAVDGALVVTYGEGGATARVGGRRHAHPGFPARPVDESGAGDAFAAGFIATRLDGAGFDDALAYGNACGAVTTEVRGARPEIDPERVQAVLQSSANSA